MKFLQISLLVVICMIGFISEVEAYFHRMKFANDKEMRFVTWQYCCGERPGGKRAIADIPESEAKRFLHRENRGLREECCNEGCDAEEINEGSASHSEELGHECKVESCHYNEVTKHC